MQATISRAFRAPETVGLLAAPLAVEAQPVGTVHRVRHLQTA
jgi:hypothetical protein